MTYSFGEVVLVNFPFSSNIGTKRRPAVIISNEDFNKERSDLILLAITSKIDKLTVGGSKINDWQIAGLLKQSAFKSVIFTIEKEYIYKVLGKLSDLDKNTLLNCLNEILGLKVPSKKTL